MLPRRLQALLSLLLYLGSVGLAHGQPPPASDSGFVSLRPGSRFDRLGDPLPAAALIRFGTSRLRQAGPVRQLYFRGDGELLSALGNDNVVHVWQVATGRAVRRLARPIAVGPSLPLDEPHMWRMRRLMILMSNEQQADITPTTAAAIDADGRWLAIEEAYDAVDLWDVATRHRVRRFHVEPPIAAVALSMDGRVVAVVTGTQSVRRFETATGKELPALKFSARGTSPSQLLFSFDGGLLAGVLGEEIRLWDTAHHSRFRKYEGHEQGVTALAFSRDSRYLASAGQDKTIRLWARESEEEVRQFAGSEAVAVSLAFSIDGTWLAAGDTEGHIRLYDVATGKQVRQFGVPGAAVTALGFSPNGQRLVSGRGDGAISLWDPQTGKLLRPNESLPQATWAKFLEGGRSIALGHADGSLTRWSSGTGRRLRRVTAPDGPFLRTAFAPHGHWVAVADAKGTLRLCDLTGAGRSRKLEAPESMFTGLVFSPAGSQLASVGMQDQTIRLWDVSSGKEQQQIHLAPEDQNNAVMNRVMQRAAVDLTFSPDGRMLAVLTTTNEVLLWETLTGKQRGRIRSHVPLAGPLVFAPTGRRLAVVAADEVIQLWDPLTSTLCGGCVGHQGKIKCLAFSADGRQLASGSEDRTIRLWDGRSGTAQGGFESDQGSIEALAFSPDGHCLLSGGADGTGLVWDRAAAGQLTPLPLMEPSRAERERWWAALAGADATVAYEAMRDMARHPAAAVALLREHLQAVPSPDPAHVQQLIEQLDQRRFAERARATRELERLDEAVVPALEQALRNKLPLEAERRLQQLLKQAREIIGAKKLRQLRAVELLDQLGTPEAIQCLDVLAHGAPAAHVTRAAKAALERLRR